MAISQNLQPQEVEFLKFQKTRWIDAKQAFEKLQVARERGLFNQWQKALQIKESIAKDIPQETNLGRVWAWLGASLWFTPPAEETGVLDVLENPVSDAVTWFGKRAVESAEGAVIKATGKEIPFLWDSPLRKNFVPSFEKAVGWLAETLWSPIESAGNVLSTLKAVLVKWAEEDPVFGRFFESSESDKVIQDALLEAGAKLKKDISEQGILTLANKKIQEDPLLVVSALTSIFKKIGRLWNISKKDQLKIDELQASAEADVEKFLKPTKEKTKETTEKIAAEVIEKDIQGTRAEVKELSKAKVEELGKDIDAFVSSPEFTGEINISKLTDELNKFEDKLIEPKSGLVIPWNEADFRFIVDTREFLENLATKTGDNLTADQSQFLKKSFNQVFKGNLTSLEKFQNTVKGKLGITLRNELAKDNPTLDALNKDFSFWISLDNVLGETIRRTKGQAEWGWLETKASTTRRDVWKGSGAAVWGTIWGTIAGTEWAVVWAALGTILWTKIANKIDVVASSPKYKLISAQKKQALADAIAEQNAWKVEKLLDAIILAEGIQFIWEPAE